MTASDYHGLLLDLPHAGPDDREWIDAALSIYCTMIDTGVHFAQAAYRDAEFPWLMDRPNLIAHPNGEVWEPELGRQLRETLFHPVGQWCVYFNASNPVRPYADDWLAKHRPPVQWIPDRPFGRANEQGMLAPFFASLRSRNVCIVGPSHLRKIPHTLFGKPLFIPVPDDGTAWKRADVIAEKVRAVRADLFLVAAGSGAALTIHRAWPHVKDRATLIDIGAVLDPYAGVFSRNKYRTAEWQRDVMPLNVP